MKSEKDVAKLILESPLGQAVGGKPGNGLGVLFKFRRAIGIGDIFILPLKGDSSVAVGEIDGDYEYCVEALEFDIFAHRRRIKWLKKKAPLAFLPEDIRPALFAPKPLFQLKQENAAERLREVAKKKSKPTSR